MIKEVITISYGIILLFSIGLGLYYHFIDFLGVPQIIIYIHNIYKLSVYIYGCV